MGTETAVLARQAHTPQELAGKYLTLRLAEETYAIEILSVQEIIGLMEITRVPQTAGYIRGVINLRGHVIPVAELRAKFGMESKADNERTCVIVAKVPRNNQLVTLGLLVDEVSEVLDITAEQIEEPPSLGADVPTDFLLGMGKVGQKVVMMLNIGKLLSNEVASAEALEG